MNQAHFKPANYASNFVRVQSFFKSKRTFKIGFLYSCVVVLIFFSCSKKDDDIVPNVFVDITLYLSNPSNVQLNSIGGWIYLSGGVKGIIVYKKGPEEFVAFDRNCTYKPSNSCSTVNIDSSGITAIDSCCGSKFQIYDGSVIKGSASFPLKQYSTSLSGSTLHIYNY